MIAEKQETWKLLIDLPDCPAGTTTTSDPEHIEVEFRGVNIKYVIHKSKKGLVEPVELIKLHESWFEVASTLPVEQAQSLIKGANSFQKAAIDYFKNRPVVAEPNLITIDSVIGYLKTLKAPE